MMMPEPATKPDPTSGVTIDQLEQRMTIYKAAIAKAKQEDKQDVAKYYQDAVRDIDYLIQEAQLGFNIDPERVPKVYSVPATLAKPTLVSVRNNPQAPPNHVHKDDSLGESKPPAQKSNIVTEEHEDEDGFVVLNNDPGTLIEKDRVELYKKLEKKLMDQAARCKQYEEQFTQSGDVAMAAKFKIFAASSTKDIDLLHIRWKNGDKFPLVSYEPFNFTIVPSNLELSSSELSVEVVKGINLPVSATSYTYVKVEFPNISSGVKQSGTVPPKPSQNPKYDQNLKFAFDKDSRAALRTIKRRSIKLDVYKKEPFWRCDSKIGSITIKLGDLANKCTMHVCYPIMNGRKATEAKLEVIVKIRSALVNKEPETVHEKWLVFT